MAKTVTTVTTQTISGDGFAGQGPIYTASQANAAGVVPGSVVLSAGANTITVPAAAVGVIIVPPSGSANAKTLKGVAGDTGILLNPAQPTTLSFTAAGVASFVINSAGGETLSLLWM